MQNNIHPDGGSRAAGPLLDYDTRESEGRSCAQCGVAWDEHPAGDGLTECAGDFPLSAAPAPAQPNESTAVQELRFAITDRRLELRRRAEDGDTTRCDELHSQIQDLESAIAILEGER